MLLAIQNENFYCFIILWVLNSDWLDNKILVTQDTVEVYQIQILHSICDDILMIQTMSWHKTRSLLLFKIIKSNIISW